MWSDVTPLSSIIAGSVGGRGSGSRREKEVDRVTHRDEEGKKRAHTRTLHSQLPACTHTNTFYTLLHVGSWPKGTAVVSFLSQAGDGNNQCRFYDIGVCVSVPVQLSL